MALKIEALEKTISFYKWELEKEDLTEKEKVKFLKALKNIKKIIQEKERSGEKRDRRFAINHKKAFLNNRIHKGY